MKKYKMHVLFEFSDDVYVEAENAEEAEARFRGFGIEDMLEVSYKYGDEYVEIYADAIQVAEYGEVEEV